VLINPLIDPMAHLVGKEDTAPNIEYIAAVNMMAETIAETIRLGCSKAELEQMDPFIKTKFIEEKVPKRNFVYAGSKLGIAPTYYLPYVTAE
jgi:hypothetical protein